MKKGILVFVLIILKLNSYAQTVGLLQHTAQSLDDGYVLFSPLGSTTTYLIDKCGRRMKTWNSAYKPGQSVYLLPDGNLLRTGNNNSAIFNAGGKGGVIEKFDWNGNVIWSYSVSNAVSCQHHDVKPMPNGNILIIAWELKTRAEAIAKGRDPALIDTEVWSEQILEIQPVGATGGNVIWEWHLFDHLIQDFDATQQNYGMVASNPQLLNINFAANDRQIDWIHLNSIDYNPVLDQIVLSAHEMSEIWVIDHSTTSEEAASHAGGNSGKGGDFLYRWGNPQAYNNGTSSDQKFFGQHNAYWIENGFPYANEIMVFNNGNGRTGGDYSTVEIINPPVNGYNYDATLPYLPVAPSWIYNEGNTFDYYAKNISGAQQLSNGNVLMANGPLGMFTEVDSSGIAVWNYVNPVSGNGILAQNAIPTQNLAFRCSFYPSDYSGFSGHSLFPGNTLENTNAQSSDCNLTLGISNATSNSEITAFPNPTSDYLNIVVPEGKKGKLDIQLFDVLGRCILVFGNSNASAQNKIDLRSVPKGIYYLTIKGESIFTKKLISKL